jgi:Bacterial surface proteins containing Ig-like domains
MAMKRCPVCGEKYSDTYKTCPFCEEEEALKDGEPVRRKGGYRSERKPSLLSPILILAILVMAGLLVYLLFGDAIAGKLGLGKNSGATPSVSEPIASESAAASEPAVSGGSSAQTTGEPPTTVVALDKEDITLPAGDSFTLTASDGTGSYTWESDDEGVASVDASGKVTGISSGTANISVNDGYNTALCIVRVKGTAPAGTGTTASGSAVISREDITLKTGEQYTLKVSGTSSAATWDTADNSVATVNENGTVTGKSSGMTKITAAVDGQTLTCIVRVR